MGVPLVTGAAAEAAVRAGSAQQRRVPRRRRWRKLAGPPVRAVFEDCFVGELSLFHCQHPYYFLACKLQPWKPTWSSKRMPSNQEPM